MLENQLDGHNDQAASRQRKTLPPRGAKRAAVRNSKHHVVEQRNDRLLTAHSLCNATRAGRHQQQRVAPRGKTGAELVANAP